MTPRFWTPIHPASTPRIRAVNLSRTLCVILVIGWGALLSSCGTGDPQGRTAQGIPPDEAAAGDDRAREAGPPPADGEAHDDAGAPPAEGQEPRGEGDKVPPPPDGEGEAGTDAGTDTGPRTEGTPVEPADFRAVLNGYEPILSDRKGDAQGKGTPEAFDLVSFHVVSTATHLLMRVQTTKPMGGNNLCDLRFWIEQNQKMVTVEIKTDHTEKVCEVAPVGEESSQEIKGCFELYETIDIHIPLDRLPDFIDHQKKFFVSGMSTCCMDEARADPYDEIDGAQEVWRY